MVVEVGGHGAGHHAEQGRRRREREQGGGVQPHPHPHRAVVAGRVDPLQDARRDDERGADHGEQEPARAAAPPRVPVAVDVAGLGEHVRQPADRGQDEGADDEEAGQQHHELDGVDPHRGQQPPGREVDGHRGPADERSDPRVEPAHGVEHRPHRDDLPGEDGEGGHPQEGRDEGADLAPVAVLEEVADGLQVVGLGEAPQAGTHPERQEERADARRPHPPPCAEAVAVPEGGRAHRRAGPDVGREQGGEEQPGTEASARHEEVARAGDPPAVPQPHRHEQSRVGEDDGEVEVHG